MGSNSSRNHLWKKGLQEWANQEGLRLMVCHFPPGTSKWNKIEHRMFCHITRNCRGKPLVSHEVIIQLIGATTTAEGWRIHVSDHDMDQLNVTYSDFHGEWNYPIQPHVL